MHDRPSAEPRSEFPPPAFALEFDARGTERDARAIIAADLYEGASAWDARAERAAIDGHLLLSAICRRNAAALRDRAYLLLEQCP